MSPTQRTIKWLKEQGCLAGIVEKFNPYAGEFGIRQDLFGFIDIVAIAPCVGIVAVQSCGQDFSGHIRKLTEERNEAVFEWLKYSPVWLVGWRKVKLKRGGKALRWAPRIADFKLVGDDLAYEERK